MIDQVYKIHWTCDVLLERDWLLPSYADCLVRSHTVPGYLKEMFALLQQIAQCLNTGATSEGNSQPRGA